MTKDIQSFQGGPPERDGSRRPLESAWEIPGLQDFLEASVFGGPEEAEDAKASLSLQAKFLGSTHMLDHSMRDPAITFPNKRALCKTILGRADIAGRLHSAESRSILFPQRAPEGQDPDYFPQWGVRENKLDMDYHILHREILIEVGNACNMISLSFVPADHGEDPEWWIRSAEFQCDGGEDGEIGVRKGDDQELLRFTVNTAIDTIAAINKGQGREADKIFNKAAGHARAYFRKIDRPEYETGEVRPPAFIAPGP